MKPPTMRRSHQPVPRISCDPVDRRVPVVEDVVVVEDHRRGHGREQPADRRLAPRLAVEPRVLLEVGDRLVRRDLGVAARADELLDVGRDLVGVDLVAEQQQRVRPLLRVALAPSAARSRISASTSRPSRVLVLA